MSGIYIPGMEMPTHCMDCPFMVSRDNDDCILQSAEANENFENWEQMKAGCPLIPVPEHGRLVDLDKIENEIAQLSPEDYTTGVIRQILDAAPTIIPADKEGEGWTR